MLIRYCRVWIEAAKDEERMYRENQVNRFRDLAGFSSSYYSIFVPEYNNSELYRFSNFNRLLFYFVT